MRILVFGDSITQGFYDPDKGGWCNRLELYAQQKTIESDWNFDKTFFNLGISGGKSDDLVKRLENEIQARKDSQDIVIVIATGANDSVSNDVTKENRVPLEEFSKNYQWLIDTAKKYGKVITVGITPVQEELLSPIPWFPGHSYLQSERERYDVEIKRLSEENSVVHISMLHIFEPTEEFLIDGVHPNSLGHERIYERIKEALEAEGIL